MSQFQSLLLCCSHKVIKTISLTNFEIAASVPLPLAFNLDLLFHCLWLSLSCSIWNLLPVDSSQSGSFSGKVFSLLVREQSNTINSYCIMVLWTPSCIGSLENTLWVTLAPLRSAHCIFQWVPMGDFVDFLFSRPSLCLFLNSFWYHMACISCH